MSSTVEINNMKYMTFSYCKRPKIYTPAVNPMNGAIYLTTSAKISLGYHPIKKPIRKDINIKIIDRNKYLLTFKRSLQYKIYIKKNDMDTLAY